MPAVTRSTYIKLAQKRGRGWLKNKYKNAWGEGARPIYKAYARQWADGYNRIVSNWSAESKPRFVGVATYIKSTGNWFVRVQIVGTQLQKDRFQMLDYGAARGQEAKTPDVTGKEAALKKGFSKQLRLSMDDYMEKNEFLEEYYRAHGGRRGNVRKSKKAYEKYMADVRKRYTKYFREESGKKVSTTAAEYSRAARRTMMPMYRYASKTGRGGRIGGSGSKSQEHKWAYEIKLGAVDARLWTVGLKGLVDEGRDRYGGAKKIWPGLIQWSTVVRNAYAAGSAAANRRGSRG